MKKLILPLCLLSTSVFCAEVDHYSKRAIPLEDSLEKVNLMANEHLQVALDRVNSTETCSLTKKSQAKLYKSLKSEFANHMKGQFTKELIHSESIDLHKTHINNSIYRDWNFSDGVVLAIAKMKRGKTNSFGLSPLININEHYIGIDKFEHMFGMGFIYFRLHHHKNWSVKSVLKHGIFREKAVLGGNIIETGVFAYADLSANFNGMRFWNHMLQLQDDVLGKVHNIGPYIKCENGKWISNKKIDFSKYIDNTMDETLNCSKFASKRSLRKFTRRIKEINPDNTCPMSSAKINKTLDKYQVKTSEKTMISDWLINTKGNGRLKFTNEFTKE